MGNERRKERVDENKVRTERGKEKTVPLRSADAEGATDRHKRTVHERGREVRLALLT